ncbi:MAG: VOC family protein [Cyanobacteria bacterium P01_G01_bin.38]
MTGEVSHIEMGSQVAEASGQFFEQLFGWQFTPMGNNGEGWFQTPSIKVGLHGNDPEPQCFVFFSVPDLKAAIARVKEFGGEADNPGPDEPGFGQFCTCRDPQGIRFGLHQPPTE